MNVKHYLIPALLSLAGWLGVGDIAHAQHGGGGHGGGGHGGGGHGGGGHGGGGHGGGGHGGGHMGGGHYGGGHYGGGHYGGGHYGGGYGYGGLGYGLGGYGIGGLGYGYGGLGYGYGGGGYGGGMYSPYYSSSYGYGSDVVPQYVVPQYSYYPSTGGAQSPYVPDASPAIPSGSAQVRVLVANPQAKIWFDGAITQQTGTDRYYHTPELGAGTTNTYRVRAAWTEGGTEVVQERVVNVASGQVSLADFRQPASEGVKAPGK